MPPKAYHSAEDLIRRYFNLLGRSGCPALDPSQESTHGGSVGPVPAGLHERARLSRLLDSALGRGWIEAEIGRALIAFYGPSAGARADMAAESCGASIAEWGRLAGEGLRKIREAMGLQEEKVPEKEKIYRGWEKIAEFLGFSDRTLQAWYHGEQEDPCGIRQAVVKVGNRTVVATESALWVCWKRLYQKDSPSLSNSR
jgi:hypothetical protein